VKILIVVRHAQAVPSSGGGDFARRLTERGEREAASVGRQLVERRLHVQQMVSSEALRALSTAESLARELGLSRGDIETSPLLYSATVRDWLQVIHDLPPDSESVALVGHNPSIAELRARLIGHDALATPPAAVAILYYDSDDWCDVGRATPHDTELLRP